MIPKNSLSEEQVVKCRYWMNVANIDSKLVGGIAAGFKDSYFPVVLDGSKLKIIKHTPTVSASNQVALDYLYSLYSNLRKLGLTDEQDQHGIHNNVFWMIRDYFPQTLKDYLPTLDDQGANRLLTDLLNLLLKLNRLNVAHGHLCPSNIIVSSKGLYLVDYAIAFSTKIKKLTPYQSPETVEQVIPDFPADFFSLGQLLKDIYKGKTFPLSLDWPDRLQNKMPADRPNVIELNNEVIDRFTHTNNEAFKTDIKKEDFHRYLTPEILSEIRNVMVQNTIQQAQPPGQFVPSPGNPPVVSHNPGQPLYPDYQQQSAANPGVQFPQGAAYNDPNFPQPEKFPSKKTGLLLVVLCLAMIVVGVYYFVNDSKNAQVDPVTQNNQDTVQPTPPKEMPRELKSALQFIQEAGLGVEDQKHLISLSVKGFQKLTLQKFMSTRANIKQQISKLKALLLLYGSDLDVHEGIYNIARQTGFVRPYVEWFEINVLLDKWSNVNSTTKLLIVTGQVPEGVLTYPYYLDLLLHFDPQVSSAAKIAIQKSIPDDNSLFYDLLTERAGSFNREHLAFLYQILQDSDKKRRGALIDQWYNQVQPETAVVLELILLREPPAEGDEDYFSFYGARYLKSKNYKLSREELIKAEKHHEQYLLSLI